MLLGAGGVAVGLPMLESMLERGGERGRARADVAPTRYALFFAGQALGGDGWAPDENEVGGRRYTEHGHYIVPDTVGNLKRKLDNNKRIWEDVNAAYVEAETNPELRWGERDFFLPPSVTRDKAKITVKLVPAGTKLVIARLEAHVVKR